MLPWHRLCWGLFCDDESPGAGILITVLVVVMPVLVPELFQYLRERYAAKQDAGEAMTMQRMAELERRVKKLRRQVRELQANTAPRPARRRTTPSKRS